MESSAFCDVTADDTSDDRQKGAQIYGANYATNWSFEKNLSNVHKVYKKKLSKLESFSSLLLLQHILPSHRFSLLFNSIALFARADSNRSVLCALWCSMSVNCKWVKRQIFSYISIFSSFMKEKHKIQANTMKLYEVNWKKK